MVCGAELCYNNNSTTNLLNHLYRRHPEKIGATANNITNKRKKRISVAWQFMHRDGPSKATCKICKRSLTLPGQGSTGCMLRHLRDVHPGTLENSNDEKLLSAQFSKSNESTEDNRELSSVNQTEPFASSNSELFSISSTKSHIAKRQDMPSRKESQKVAFLQHSQLFTTYTQLIISDLHPCSLVESTGFKNFVKMINPKVTVPEKKKIEDDMLQLHKELQNQLQKQIDEAADISLSIEIWKYKEGQKYMTVTGHFVSKNWEQKSVILNSVLLDRFSTLDVDIAEKLVQIMKNWEIESKVSSITTDGSELLASVVLQVNKPHVQCIAHVLNNMVQKSLKSSHDFECLVTKVRYMASLFDHSVEASEELRQLQTLERKTPIKLSKDSEAEWITTYKMLKSYQELHTFILKLVKDETTEGNISLTSEEFDSLNRYVSLLEPFFLAAEEITSEGFISLSKCLPVFEILQQMIFSQVKIGSDSKEIFTDSSLAEKDSVHALTIQLNEQLGEFVRDNVTDRKNILSYSATLFDPRFKLIVLKDADLYNYVENELKVQMKENEVADSVDENPFDSPAGTALNTHSSSLWSSFDETVKMSVREKPVYELQRYIEENPVSRQEIPLLYWKEREPLYPKLCNVVKKFLSIPATSVPSIQVFSEEEKKKMSRRSFLEESNIDRILFLNSFQASTQST